MKYIEKILEYKLFELKWFTVSVLDILIVLLIFSTARFLVYLINALIKKNLSKKGIIDEGRAQSASQIFKYIIYILSVIIILRTIGFDISIVFGVFAALGLGIGFALQDVFKDLISGIIILFEGNVAVGDILEVDGVIGTVTEIKLRTSLIRTRNGIFIVVPNNRIVNEKVINWSTNTKITRFNVSVGVAYGSDVEKVKELLLNCAFVNEQVSNTPESLVVFQDFGDSALLFELNFWVLEIWSIEVLKSDLRFAINKSFRENNIQIPFPQRDVHLIQK